MSVGRDFGYAYFPRAFEIGLVRIYFVKGEEGGVGLNWGSGASFWSVLSPTYHLVYQYMKSFS